MLKSIFATIILVGLIGWGSYDHLNLQKDNANLAAKTNTISESKLNEGDVEVQTSANSKVGLKEGNIAPDFQLETLNGDNVRLSDFQGKKVILNFWATWCPPCKAEMPHMQKFYEEHGNKEVEILAVNLRNLEQGDDIVTNFVNDYGLTFPILLDTKKIADQYQAFSIPTSYAIDSEGRIQYKMVGPMNEALIEKLVSSMR